MISSNNIFYHELIGLELKVVDSSNSSLIGLSGTVIDETKKTLKIELKEKSLDSKENEFNHFNNGLSSNQENVLSSNNKDLISNQENVLSSNNKDLASKNNNLSFNQNFIIKEKLIQKDVSIFQFKVPDGTIVEIDGKILLNRPEDRIKKRYKKI